MPFEDLEPFSARHANLDSGLLKLGCVTWMGQIQMCLVCRDDMG